MQEPSSILGWGRSHGGGNGNPLQYSCLKNPVDRGAWQATIYGVTESDTTEGPNTSTMCPQPSGRTTVTHLGEPVPDHSEEQASGARLP